MDQDRGHENSVSGTVCEIKSNDVANQTLSQAEKSSFELKSLFQIYSKDTIPITEMFVLLVEKKIGIHLGENKIDI